MKAIRVIGSSSLNINIGAKMPTYDYKDKATLESLKAEGKTIAQMAKACGCSVPTMSNWLKKHGLAKARGPRKGSKAAAAAAPAAGTAGKTRGKGRGRGRAAAATTRSGRRGRASGGIADIEAGLGMLRNAPAGMDSYKDAIKQDLVRMIQAL